MWRRAYLLLALVRLYFALSPSYLHPDENFQGPEVIAGQIFSYPVKLTWEFTDANPIRSVFPLWPIYGLPMLLLKWLWIGAQHSATSEISPKVVFYTLRVLMFFLSFVLEDWAIHELCPKPRERRVAMLLLSSSYVTWTFQTHTFSNSIETIVVLWSLVLVQRILDDRRRTSPFASALLAILVVFGTFTRITFPAFLIIPGFRLLPHFYRKPLSFLIMVATGLATLFLAVAIDTELYTPHPVSLTTLFTHPVITPLNNLRYNLNSSNLALHGTHPYYQHALINLPQLLGPAFILLFLRPKVSLRFWSAISGLVVLSAFSHQEARFLLPCVPLLLSCIRLPGRRRQQRLFMGAWVAFNVVMGVLMGTYHQGGVVPVQFWLAENVEVGRGAVVWWRTYSPPVWLLDGKNEVLATHDMMGVPGTEMIQKLGQLVTCEDKSLAGKVAEVMDVAPKNEIATYLVAPLSAKFLSTYTSQKEESKTLEFEKVFQYRTHLNLDDMDFGDDGVWPTISRVIGRRGLAVWKVTKRCGEPEV